MFYSWLKRASLNLLHSPNRYVLGGFDGETMVSSVEIFDPRLGKWMVEETTMNHARGYFGAAVVQDSIYVIGGVNNGCQTLVDTVSKSINISLSYL
jgi:kelch-like protein 20